MFGILLQEKFGGPTDPLPPVILDGPIWYDNLADFAEALANADYDNYNVQPVIKWICPNDLIEERASGLPTPPPPHY